MERLKEKGMEKRYIVIVRFWDVAAVGAQEIAAEVCLHNVRCPHRAYLKGRERQGKEEREMVEGREKREHK